MSLDFYGSIVPQGGHFSGEILVIYLCDSIYENQPVSEKSLSCTHRSSRSSTKILMKLKKNKRVLLED